MSTQNIIHNLSCSIGEKARFMGKVIATLFFCWVFVAVHTAQAQSTGHTYAEPPAPEHVVVIYNSDYTTDANSNGTQDSLEIAQYYQAARSIPASNVIGIAMPTTEVITRAQYNTLVRDQLRTALSNAGLENSTRFLVLTKGVPLKVSALNSSAYEAADYASVSQSLTLLYQDNSIEWRLYNPYYNVDPDLDKTHRFTHGSYTKYTLGELVVMDYLVTRLDGYSVQDVKAMIDRALEPEDPSSSYWVIDGHNKDYDSMPSAASTMNAYGYTVVPDPWVNTTQNITTAPGNVMGYVGHGIYTSFGDGYISNDLQFSYANGAVFSSYESFNAFGFTSPTQSTHGQVAEFVAEGGSGGIGFVYEPWSSSMPEEPIWMSAYARGYSWAEAAYMSLPFTDFTAEVVGDPLMTIGDAQAPVSPSNTTVTAQELSLVVSWDNPNDSDFSYVQVVRSTSGYPMHQHDGEVVYQGTRENFIDTDVVVGTTYYYSIIAFDPVANYSPVLSGSQASGSPLALQQTSKAGLVLTMLLEGPAEPSGSMSSSLATDIPTTSPYDPSVTVSTIESTIIDWVEIELRTISDGAAVVTKSALLRQDGYVVDPENQSGVLTTLTIPQDVPYYIVVRHRNHLDAITLDDYEFITGQVVFVDTTAASVLDGTQTDIGNGYFALRAGDVNGSNAITSVDSSAVNQAQGLTGYVTTELDYINGVSAADLQLVQNNVTTAGAVADPRTQGSAVVRTKAMLEGPFNSATGNMKSTLSDINYLPLTSPYAEDPANVTQIPDGVVDWALLELRSDTETAVYYKSVFLHKSGELLDIDGTPYITTTIIPGDYYVIIRHRNHLDVMSKQAISLYSDRAFLVDLSDYDQVYSAAYGLKQLSGNIYGMRAGDANGDGGIDAIDNNLYISPYNGQPWSYNTAGGDLNLDGGFDSSDINLYWRPNNGTASQVPIATTVDLTSYMYEEPVVEETEEEVVEEEEEIVEENINTVEEDTNEEDAVSQVPIELENIEVYISSRGWVILKWDVKDGYDIDYVKIHRSGIRGVLGGVLATNITSEEYKDKNPIPDKRHYYTIRTVINGVESDNVYSGGGIVSYSDDETASSQNDRLQVASSLIADSDFDDTINAYQVGDNARQEIESKYLDDFKHSLSPQVQEQIVYFIAYGFEDIQKIGRGERASTLYSFEEAYGRLPATRADWENALRIAAGRWPTERISAREDAMKQVFAEIYQRPLNLENKRDEAALMILAYGLRPLDRNLISENKAQRIYRSIFNHKPKTTQEWNIVRAIAYSGTSR